MICRVRMNSRCSHTNLSLQKGFSLLEIVVVLGILAVIVTWVTVSVANVDTERQLREAAAKIVSKIGQARSVAVRQQRPYTITITAESVTLAPEFSSEEEEDFDDEGDELSIYQEDITSASENDADLTYEVLRWQSDDWKLMEDKESVIITVEPSGLVEPISIRCTKGKSWLIQELHPLTGRVRDEQMSIEE